MAKKILFYDDDFTREEVIPEGKFLPEIRFTYKPLTAWQAAQFTQKIVNSKTLEAALAAHIELISKHVVSWNLTKPDDTPIIPTDSNTLYKVDAYVINKVATAIKERAGDLLNENELKNLSTGSSST